MIKHDTIIDIEWSVNHLCNLDCSYCYLAKNLRTDPKRNCNIRTLEIMNFMNSLDHKCNLILYGGEPFIIPNLIEACATITKQHYVSFVTNLVGKHIDNFSKKISPEKVLFIRPSLHYQQLNHHKKTDLFINNYNLLKQSGFNMLEVEMVIHPTEINRFEEIFADFYKQKIKIKPVVFEGLHKGKTYPRGYTSKDINIIKKALSILEESEAELLFTEFVSRAQVKSNNVSYYKYECIAGSAFYWIDIFGNVYRCVSDRRKICNIFTPPLPQNLIVSDKCRKRVCLCAQQGMRLAQGIPAPVRYDPISLFRAYFREPMGYLRKLFRI